MAALAVVAALAPVPTLAAGPVRLSAGSVSPTSGTTATGFTFRVRYASPSNVAPRSVRVIIDGIGRAMSPAVPADRNYKDGAVFRLTTTLAAGRHAYDFAATDSKGRRGSLPGGFVVVTVPPTGGSGTTAPTPGRSDGGTPTDPESGSGAPSAPATGSGSSGSGSNAAGSGSSPSGSGDPSESGAAGPEAPTSEPAGDAPDPTVESARAPGTGSTAAGALGVLAATGGVSLVILPELASPRAAAIGAVAAGQGVVEYAPVRPAPLVVAGRPRLGLDFLPASVPGYGSDPWARAIAQTLAVSTTSSVTFAVALLFLARRRREQQEAAAREQDESETPLDEVALAGYLYGPQRAAAMAAELALPRWRRPSVQAARLAPRDRPREQMAHERLTFDEGTLAMANGREFRKIRYRMVRLSDRPDEILGYELARLDAGDEVEILERSGSYVQIRTPFGLEGWVHRTTVGGTVQAGDRLQEAPPERDFPYIGPDESLVVRLIRERSAASG